MMTNGQISVAEHARRLDEQMKQAAYKGIVASIAEEIWQRPMRKAREQEVRHLKTVFAPEVIVEKAEG